jgi:hypothetical protein
MASLAKLIAAFKNCNGPFPWRKFEQLMSGLGYELVYPGRTGGSRRRFYNPQTRDLIFLHEPHDGEMGPGMVRRLQTELETKGLI